MTLAVVYYNERLNLPRLLLSFEKNFIDEKRSIKFLFLDNASEDHSFEIIEKWMSANRWVQGQNIRRATNQMAQARQQALSLCEDPWLAFIDADCELESHWFKNVENAISNSSQSTVAIGGQSTYKIMKPWH